MSEDTILEPDNRPSFQTSTGHSPDSSFVLPQAGSDSSFVLLEAGSAPSRLAKLDEKVDKGHSRNDKDSGKSRTEDSPQAQNLDQEKIGCNKTEEEVKEEPKHEGTKEEPKREDTSVDQGGPSKQEDRSADDVSVRFVIQSASPVEASLPDEPSSEV